MALGADLDGMDSKLEGSGYGCYGPVARKLNNFAEGSRKDLLQNAIGLERLPLKIVCMI